MVRSGLPSAALSELASKARSVSAPLALVLSQSAELTVGLVASSLSGQFGWWVHRAVLEAALQWSVCLLPALSEFAPGLAPSWGLSQAR